MRSPEQKLHARIRNFNLKQHDKWLEIIRWTDWFQKPHVDGDWATVFLIYTLKGHEPSPNTLKFHQVKLFETTQTLQLVSREELLQRAVDEFIREFPFKLTDIVPFGGGQMAAPHKKSFPLPDYIE